MSSWLKGRRFLLMLVSWMLSNSLESSYAEKRFIHRIKDTTELISVAEQLWEGVRANDKKIVYRLVVVYQTDVNAVHGEASPGVCLCSVEDIKRYMDRKDRILWKKK